jgi:hypothetical protein
MDFNFLNEIEKNYLTTYGEDCSNFADFIFEMVKNFYDTAILSNLKPKDNEWTVFSSVVLQNDGLFKVITFANGTKSLPNKNYSNREFRIFDSHAEVLALRSLKHFIVKLVTFSLMKRLNINNDGKYNTKEEYDTYEYNSNFFDIFIWSDEKLILKEKVFFHLYISEPPCGDCTIVPVRYNNIADTQHTGSKVIECFNTEYLKLPHNNEKGKCRSKSMRSDIDKDNISYSLSCSDKLLFKNILGIQGKLLSRIVESIYLSSVIISTKESFVNKPIELFEYRKAISQGMSLRGRDFSMNNDISIQSLGFVLNEPSICLTNKTLLKQINTLSLSFSSYWYYGKIAFTKIDPIIGFKQGTISKPKSLEKSRVDICIHDFLREFMILLSLYSDYNSQYRNLYFDQTITRVNESVDKPLREIIDFVASRFYRYLKEEIGVLLKIDGFLKIKKNILN